MSQANDILDFIKRNCKVEVFIKGLKDGKNLGITALEIQNEYGILRNNASSIVNLLCKNGKLVKINSRPVTFIDKEILNEMNKKYNVPIKNIYTFNELREYILNTSINDPFEMLLGYNSSLLSQVRQAKAAIVYPPKGLHTLLLGESGVGKTTFAQAMHAYGLLMNNKENKDYPFVTFNCADYFNNPQLLLSQLFGHVKGAFTGADTDKIGLVEKANGGILFLDEVHRLPPDGQEMLFYLMDKGEYNRLGDGSKRKSNVLIIAATTEDPSTTLLNTFIRRVPVNIILPRYKDKPIAEKIELIEQFFRFEAINLQQEILIAPEVLKALALFDFIGGNIGQLRSEIKLLCANAFLQYLQNNQRIYVGYQMLNKEIRDVLLNYLKLDKSITSYLNMFSEDIVIRPNSKNIEYEETNDIYEIITKKLDSLKQKGVALENITDVLKTDIDNYLCSVSKHFNNTNSNLNNLYKLVSKDIVLATMQFIEYAREKLQVNFSNHFLFSLSLHIQELIKRVEENNVSSNQHLFKIKKEHPEEFSVANDLVKKISNKFGIIVPESEKGFLALLLFHSRVEISDNNKIGIIIICHGDSTATSIANTCNMLLNTNMMKAIDMPLSQSIDETYKKLKSMALAINKGKGIIILADMGSLLDFDKKLTSETGIKTKVVKNVSTPIALEMLRHVLYDMEDIDNVYEQAKFVEDNCNKIVVAKKKELAILSVCATGKGSSIIAKNILEELIDKYYADKIKIIPVDLENAKDVFKKMQDRYYILAVVGTIDPILPIPFFPINQLMQSEIQQVFFHLLDGNINGIFMLPENKANYTIFETAKDLLEKYVKFINPKYAITKIRKFIEKIEYNPKNEEYVLDLMIHMGCMLDRCLSKIDIKYNNLDLYKEKEKLLFDKIIIALKDIEQDYNIKISDDEVAYIVKIITTKK